jgi:M6 family metalloprotease-like protein
VNKRLVALISLLSISLLLPLLPANAKVKAGGSCKKAGATSVAFGKTYKCIKSGKKLIWNLNSKNSKSTQVNEKIATVPISELSDPSRFSNLDKCRIKHLNPHGTSMVAGFPVVDKRVNLVEGLKAQIIGVDFPDKPAKDSLQGLNETYIQSTEDFYKNQASIPLKFEWHWNQEWIRMSKPVKDYDLGGNFQEGKFRPAPYFSLIREILRMADPTVDFTGTNLILIIFPPGMSFEEVGSSIVHTQGTYDTDEQTVYNLMLAGGNNHINHHWYRHELGHALGLTDIRDTQDVTNQKSGGMFYDVMNNHRFEELLVWHRFLLGFLKDGQIQCVTTEEVSTHWLSPAAMKTDNTKGVVIPLNEEEAIILESRRAIGYDKLLSQNPTLVGAVVYTLDTRVPYGQSPVKVVEVLQDGESITTNGYKFSVMESGTFGDVVRIEKVS